MSTHTPASRIPPASSASPWIEVISAVTPDERLAALEIRRRVFAEEQGVADLHVADSDDARSVIALATLPPPPTDHGQRRPVSTGRLTLPLTRGGQALVAWVATIPEARGQGAGGLVMRFLLDPRRTPARAKWRLRPSSPRRTSTGGLVFPRLDLSTTCAACPTAAWSAAPWLTVLRFSVTPIPLPCHHPLPHRRIPRRRLGPEHAVAGIAKSRPDVGVLIELAIEHRHVNSHVRVVPPETLHPLRCGDQPHECDFRRSPPFQRCDRRRCRAPGS